MYDGDGGTQGIAHLVLVVFVSVVVVSSVTELVVSGSIEVSVYDGGSHGSTQRDFMSHYVSLVSVTTVEVKVSV